jgi:hypothetical protein
MTNNLEIRIKLEITEADACFMDVDIPARPNAAIGTHTCRPNQELSGIEAAVLIEWLRYAAVNENVSEEWIKAGIKKRLNVVNMSKFLHRDFARVMQAMIDVIKG